MAAEQKELKQEELVKALQKVGLAAGDSVIVHSAYRRLRPVEGGPATVIRALLEVLGPHGNLALPTFNYSIEPPATCFDPARTPGLTGIIPEIGRAWPGAIRSIHPTHSVAVLGPQAEELTRDHGRFRSVGIGSPLDRLAKREGKVLLIGVGHVSNSMVHIGEEYAGVPKAPWAIGLPVYQVRLPDGRLVPYQSDTSSSCSTAFGAVEFALRSKGQIRDLRLGVAKFQLMRAQDVIDNVVEMVKQKPDILLCTNPGCVPCTGARKNLGRKDET